MKTNIPGYAVSSGIEPALAHGAAAPREATKNPPPPPGGGRWRWTGSDWEDLNPKPVEADADPINPSVTE